MKSLHRISLLYLSFPFLLFCFGWLRLFIALPIAAVTVYAVWILIRSDRPDNGLWPKHMGLLLFFTGLWVFLSGVGGYAFQNWDHHWRNAVLRDLITNTWPVYYAMPEKGPVTMLVYYVGYWLPAAAVGRLFGWQAANAALFLWTWLGVMLVLLNFSTQRKTPVFKTMLFFAFFSGMDVLGTLFFAKDYPTLLPPITHLETWGGPLQYSSFTTQLFWVFNQAVPAWLCIVMVLHNPRREEGAFFWALSFFFAPLASIGLLPYLLIEWIRGTDFRSPFKSLRWDVLMAGGLIALVSFLFFSSNPAAQERGFQSLALNDYLFFFLLDGGLLLLLLAPYTWRNPYWVVTALMLAVMPFVQFGNGRDFVMRVSIAPLLSLMMMTADFLWNNSQPRAVRMVVTILLIIGALTPLYEIDRSVYRTVEYYFLLDEDQRLAPPSEPATRLDQNVIPEKEHPGMLVADAIQTLRFMDDKLSKNFIANVRPSFYYQYMAPR